MELIDTTVRYSEDGGRDFRMVGVDAIGSSDTQLTTWVEEPDAAFMPLDSAISVPSPPTVAAGMDSPAAGIEPVVCSDNVASRDVGSTAVSDSVVPLPVMSGKASTPDDMASPLLSDATLSPEIQVLVLEGTASPTSPEVVPEASTNPVSIPSSTPLLLTSVTFSPSILAPSPFTSEFVHTRLGKSVEVKAEMIFADPALLSTELASKVADMALFKISSSPDGALSAVTFLTVLILSPSGWLTGMPGLSATCMGVTPADSAAHSTSISMATGPPPTNIVSLKLGKGSSVSHNTGLALPAVIPSNEAGGPAVIGGVACMSRDFTP
jgi:hypothetical protein